MILSIVTGTYNRLHSLQRMIASAQLPRGLTYEFVIVDGGSTDGTLEWCRRQPDIRLIEHGTLHGAIRAFCDGARAAQGEYVVLANDDIVFEPFGLLAAIAHLEKTPTCGGVAFADNRTSLVHGDGRTYRVESVSATTADGTPVMVHYAQVGMFRRWLGEVVGWWGDRDPLMSQARTYGGDNFLSACIWEMGFTIDPVSLARIEDRIERDALRNRNASTGSSDSALYYQRFPTIQLPDGLIDAPKIERLRILHLPIYEPNYPGRYNAEAGLTEALAAYGLAIEWDYVNEPVDQERLVSAWQPDLIVSQIQAADAETVRQIAAVRAAAPNAVIVNWNGDIHLSGLLEETMIDVLRYVDLQTTVNAQVLPEYERLGIRAAYWQIAYKDPVGSLPPMPFYEVLFQGNCYNTERYALMHAISGVSVGIYGNCPDAQGNTHYDFAAQRSLYQQATITISDTFAGGYAYVSNRLFQALAAGAFVLQQHSPGLQEYTGLTAGIHFAEWQTVEALPDLIAYWRDPAQADQRRQIAAQGCAFVRANFSYAAQVDKLFNDLLPLLTEAEHATV